MSDMNLADVFSQYFGFPPISDPQGDGFLMFSVSEHDLTLEVSLHEAESLVSINIRSSSQDELVFCTLQRNIGETTIKTDTKGQEYLWFKSENNAVFIIKSPISVHFKG